MERSVPHVVLGRDAGCQVVVDDPSVSGRHARLSWTREGLVIEDLGSTNGTWAFGEKITRAVIRRGDDVHLGDVPLPWGDQRLGAFLRLGDRKGTIVGRMIPARRFTCGRCGAVAALPAHYAGGPVACPRCKATLVPSATRRRPARGLVLGVSVGAALIGTAIVGFLTLGGGGERLITRITGPKAGSPEEQYIRDHRAGGIVAAIDATHALTRDSAVRLAAKDDGPYHVEQVARIWSHVRGSWRYVNDPRGNEYFAKASQTIANEYAGDCDDFAITLAAMTTAIGGEARIVLMDGPEGGHAYAEVCVRQEPKEVATRLARHYKRNWDRYMSKLKLSEIHYRSTTDCPVWLNLDWNAQVPGGPYADETWAVAVSTDGRTETLTPAGQLARSGTDSTSRVRAAALPPVQ